jgi:hypothetical protein
MPYVVLTFVCIVCLICMIVSIPIFFVREMRSAASKLLLSALGGYLGSGVAYASILWEAGWIPAVVATILVFLGLMLGIRVGHDISKLVNRKFGWD